MNIDRTDFISAMRNVANSVTVVTTNGPAGQHGATVSAFCSVSADPPTALVCLNSKSRIADLVTKNGKFNINILAEGTRHYAERFSGMHDHSVPDRFQDIEAGNNEMPELPGSTVLTCDIDQCIVSGSHHIIIGKVRAVVNGENHPLTYLDGTYYQVMPLQQKVQRVADG
ncbi:MAG: flavin reductase family protein [Pseudomonadota bacterium]